MASGSESEPCRARLDELVFGGIDNNNFSTEDELEAPPKDSETGQEEICMDPRGPNIENADEAEVVFRRNNFLHRQKWRIIKNVAFLCLGCLLDFTAVLNAGDFREHSTKDFNFLRYLVLFGSTAIGCLFLVQPIIVLVTTKWAVTASFIGHSLYVIAHFYPTEELILASMAVLGVSFSLCLSAVGAYLAKAADVYSVLTNASLHATVCKFYGVFFMVCQSTHVWSRLIAGFILQTIKKPPEDNYSNPLPPCGVSACPSNGSHGNSFVADEGTNIVKLYTVYGISTLLSLLAALTSAVCVGRLPSVAMLSSISMGNNRHSNKQCSSKAKLFFCSVIKTVALWFNGKLFFSIPLLIHLGLQIGFFHLTFMRHYASCSVGAWRMPFVYITYGGMSALSAMTCSGAAKCISRTASLIIAALLQLGLFVWLFLWQLRDFHFYVFFAVLGVWAIADGIWIVTVSSFHGNVFSSNEEAAFANFVLWQTIGASGAYFGGNFICVYMQLYVLMGSLCLGLAGHFTAEVIVRKIKLNEISGNI